MKSYNKQVALLCPVCGNDQFESLDLDIEGDDLIDAVDEIRFRCSDCGAVLTKEELISENREKISIGIGEVEDSIIRDIETELKKELKKWKL